MTTHHDDSGSSHLEPQPGTAVEHYSHSRNWLVTLPTAILLLLAVLFGTSAFIHGQLLSFGGQLWGGYSALRADMAQPSCNPNPDIDQRVEQITQGEQTSSDSLFDAGPTDPEALRQSLIGQRNQCRQAFERYEYNREVTATTGLQVYRAIELTMGRISQVGSAFQSYILVLFIMIGGFVALALNEQIALRFPKFRTDYRVAAAAQIVVNGFMAVSALAWLRIDSGGAVWLNSIWLVGFSLLTLGAIYRLVRLPAHADPGGSIGHALLAIPLYCWLGFTCGAYFFFVEMYPAGPAIQLNKMIAFADLYTAIGLYVWVGMMLKHTQLAKLLFDVFHSWELRPEFIVILVVLGAALPTAYTGASGIFVMAAGAVIYQELRIAGAYRNLAVASTAMSGSMGVVLSPCLMVVIIAALNRQVTTDQLFGWGVYVFLLSAAIFIAAVYLTRKSTPHVSSPGRALPRTGRALMPLIPYVLIGAVVILAYSRLLGVGLNEFSAPVILPLMMLFLLGYDRWRAKRKYHQAREAPERITDADSPAAEKPAGFWNALRAATAETSVLIGALLLLMVLSIVFGGVAGRSGVMELFPENLGSVWLAMALLVVMLVIIGMIMDPYGAIILVSATIAPVAYANGINPIHFWMCVLVAFELGYLTPPVALNQLLTRQVVGDREIQLAKAEVADDPSFWRRHEALLLPLSVMATALLLTAFAPLIYMALFQ